MIYIRWKYIPIQLLHNGASFSLFSTISYVTSVRLYCIQQRFYPAAHAIRACEAF